MSEREGLPEEQQGHRIGDRTARGLRVEKLVIAASTLRPSPLIRAGDCAIESQWNLTTDPLRSSSEHGGRAIVRSGSILEEVAAQAALSPEGIARDEAVVLIQGFDAVQFGFAEFDLGAFEVARTWSGPFDCVITAVRRSTAQAMRTWSG